MVDDHDVWFSLNGLVARRHLLESNQTVIFSVRTYLSGSVVNHPGVRLLLAGLALPSMIFFFFGNIVI